MAAINLAGGIEFPYTATDLTREINRIPNMYGRLNELNLFPAEGVASTLVEIKFEDGFITILAAEDRGKLGSVGREPVEGSIWLEVPHIPHEDAILAKSLQNRFRFGSGRKQLAGIADETAKKLRYIRQRHAITLEYLRMGALKGQIVDGRSRVLYDLFQVFAPFGVSKKIVYFNLDDPDTDVAEKTFEVARHMEDNAKGETVSGIHALVSREFFSKLVAHKSVKEKYLATQSALQIVNKDIRKGFTFGAITFEEYNAVASDLTGASRRFIAAGKGHVIPLGTQQAFATYFAPADTIEDVNTEGTPEVFISIERMKHGKGIDMHSESNPLPLCQRVDLLVELDMAAPPP
jgi:hypothetical protein